METIVEIIEPTEIRGGRLFKVTLDGVPYLSKVRIFYRHPSGLYYRIFLLNLEGERVIPFKNNWRVIRKKILSEMLKKHIGMTPAVARFKPI